jgi:hypothetical protein
MRTVAENHFSRGRLISSDVGQPVQIRCRGRSKWRGVTRRRVGVRQPHRISSSDTRIKVPLLQVALLGVVQLSHNHQLAPVRMERQYVS